MDNKYDRQVRLWSTSGQEALKASHVAIIGLSNLTLDAARGLVLAGVGAVTLVLSEPTFGTAGSIYSSEPSTMAERLQELNEDSTVVLSAFPEDVKRPVTLVIRSSPNKYSARSVAERFNAPILTAGAHRLTGFVRLDASELSVVDAHPELGLADLRIRRETLEHWPEYAAYCNSFDLENLSDTDHAHVPACVLLAKALKNNDMSARDVISELRNMARSAAEENFEEAITLARQAMRAEVPLGVRELVRFREEHRSEDVSAFWLLIGALGTYISKYGILPISGEIPDMISSTENFVALRRLYAARLEADEKRLLSFLPPGTAVSDDYLRRFCKNARYLKYVYRNKQNASTEHEYEKLAKESQNPEIPPVAAYLGGVASQEATKIIMHHYMPFLGLLLYDGEHRKLFGADTDLYTVIDAQRT